MAQSEQQSESRTLLRKAAREIRIVGFLDYRRYLKNLYRWVKRESESYSYILFSIDTGLGKSNASRLIISGKRNLSNKHAADVAENLGLRGHQALYFSGMVRYANARTSLERDEAFSELMHSKMRIDPDSLTAEQVSYFSVWLNPVIKEAAAARNFVGDVDWIQEILNFPVRRDEVKRAVGLLSDLEVFKPGKSADRIERTGKELRMSKVDDLAAIRYHQSMIEAGKESLTRLPGNMREISGVTALLSPETYELVREKIKKLADEIEQLEQADRKKNGLEVYQLNMQLFPFTCMNKKDQQ